MLLSHLKRLCITSATLIAASPQATVVSKANSLPSSLQQNVPVCAQSCLQNSILDRFPVACTGSDSIQCLCSRYSNIGESLGEVALGCVYSACSATDGGAGAAYNVCIGQKDAVMPTKSVLTVVATNPPRTSSPTPSSKAIVTSASTPTSQAQTTPTPSVNIDSISSTLSATTSPSPSSAAASATTDGPPKMTPAQIAGLSVAAVAAFIIAIALMALSICVRRRRERKTEFDSDEKGLGRKSKKLSTRASQYVPVNIRPGAPKQFPMLPPQTKKKPGQYPGNTFNANIHPALRPALRPVQQNGVGTSNSSSSSTLPLDQIGVAISAELDGKAIMPKAPVAARAASNEAAAVRRQSVAPFRPTSTMTQETVFEEDEPSSRRRSSVLLPTPPVPIAPIRNLQPSRQTAAVGNATGFPIPPNSDGRKGARRSELFLDIPIRHERPQPKMVVPVRKSSKEPPPHAPSRDTNRLAPPIQIIPTAALRKTPESSTGSNNAGDIDDYYFTARTEITPRSSPAQFVQRRDSPKVVQIRSKASRSTVPSRASSRASTNIRDSVSSQTSFETVDPNDPTPEDEDDKQLSDDSKLSPVAESPISNLRYPKVPRSSNQLVPRSPRSPQSSNLLRTPQQPPSAKKTQPSPRPTPSSSAILQHRHKNLAPPLLETRLPLKLNAPKDMAIIPGPLQDPFTSPPRAPRARAHIRSNSTESWSTTPRSNLERQSRVQSGMWPSSPAMYEVDVVRPLNVKRKEPLSIRRQKDEMREINVGRDVEHDVQGVKSPVWVPRLTPTRKGEDLFISVGWGERRF